jgi:pimeloyl-ACP methyl ester carboxylesterase
MYSTDRSTTSSGMADVSAGVRLHYRDIGDGQRTAVLLHGFPQTAHEWRHVIPRLVAGGFRAVAPDYRGAGWSSKPASGFDKQTLAADIHTLTRTHLGIADPIVLVGHDIGAMIAIAYALEHRDEVSHLVVIDAPVPGTAAFDRMRGDPRGWHAAFHTARDVAELLVRDRERAYLQHLIEVRIFDPSAILAEDFDVYVRAYEAPGAMRAAFELYRTFEDDARAVRSALSERGKLEIPVLAIGGEHSGLGAVIADMVREIAEHVEVLTAPRSGHWVPEENPVFLSDALLRFVSTGTPHDCSPALTSAGKMDDSSS